VDTETQELMRQLIRTEFQATTVIAVAHRLETILDFDAVAVLVDGAVAEFDQPQALLSRPRSALRSLYDGGQEKVKSRAE
jgi:ATP-binding cassette, subfamily C (CFTR/MRP), member 1